MVGWLEAFVPLRVPVLVRSGRCNHLIELDGPPVRRTVGVDATDAPRLLGLLLEQGHVEKAAAVYAADLGLDPQLSRSSQPSVSSSTSPRVGADVLTAASCACRLDVVGDCCSG